VQAWAAKNEILPRWNYFPSIIRRSYQEFKPSIEASRTGPAKTELVRQAILAQTGPRAVAQPCAQVPAASPPLVKKVLAHMKQKGDVRLIGRGRGAQWEVEIRWKGLEIDRPCCAQETVTLSAPYGVDPCPITPVGVRSPRFHLPVAPSIDLPKEPVTFPALVFSQQCSVPFASGPGSILRRRIERWPSHGGRVRFFSRPIHIWIQLQDRWNL